MKTPAPAPLLHSTGQAAPAWARKCAPSSGPSGFILSVFQPIFSLGICEASPALLAQGGLAQRCNILRESDRAEGEESNPSLLRAGGAETWTVLASFPRHAIITPLGRS